MFHKLQYFRSNWILVLRFHSLRAEGRGSTKGEACTANNAHRTRKVNSMATKQEKIDLVNVCSSPVASCKKNRR